MNWQFWKKNNSSLDLPDEVRAAVEAQFQPDPEFMSRLQCAQWVKNSSGKSVRYVRVFDPTLVESGARPVSSYDDLKRHKRAIQFEGHIDQKSGSIYIADRRPMSKRTPRAEGDNAAPSDTAQAGSTRAV